MIQFTVTRSVRRKPENTIRDNVYRTLFALSCSKFAFEYSKALFAKYLWHTQSYVGVHPTFYCVSQLPYVVSWSPFEYKNTHRLCLQCAWGSIISVLCFVVCDLKKNYRVVHLSKESAKEGYIVFPEGTQGIHILNMSKRKSDIEVSEGMSWFNLYSKRRNELVQLI